MNDEQYEAIKKLRNDRKTWREIFMIYNLKYRSISDLKLKFGRESHVRGEMHDE